MKSNTNLDFTVAAHLREIHEIEFTSRCQLACRYCPHPKMKRAKADMTEATFQRVLAHLQHLCAAGTQGEVSMTGIGEAILHPQFVEWMHWLREVIGADRRLVLATNGLAITAELAREIKAANCIVYVSTHRPEKAGPALELLRAAGVTCGVNTAFVDDAIDWAGQVPWHVSAQTKVCEYLARRWCAIRQDGSVNTCCMDAEGLHPIGHVMQPVGSIGTFVTPICAACHLAAPVDFRVGNVWSDEILAEVERQKQQPQEAQVRNEVKSVSIGANS
jgi:hypothetical protein